VAGWVDGEGYGGGRGVGEFDFPFWASFLPLYCFVRGICGRTFARRRAMEGRAGMRGSGGWCGGTSREMRGVAFGKVRWNGDGGVCRRKADASVRQIEQVERQTATMDPKTNFRVVVLQTELERWKFLVRSFLRSRIAKVGFFTIRVSLHFRLVCLCSFCFDV